MGFEGSTVQERQRTGYPPTRECCPADGLARKSGTYTDGEIASYGLPPTKKEAIDVSQDDYTVPARYLDQVRGISFNSVNGTAANINMLCIHDATADVVCLEPNVIHNIHVQTIYAANTTATGIILWF